MDTKKSKKNRYSVGEIIAGVIGIVFFGAIGCSFIIMALMVGFCVAMDGDGPTIAVYETSISPTGLYQAEAVREMGGGAAGYDDSYFYVEVADDESEFSCEGDEPSNYINISGLGTGSAFTQYDIQWISDDTFTVTYGTRYGQVTMNGREYYIKNGEFKTDRNKSYFISYEETDEDVYYNCLLSVKNPLDCPVAFDVQCIPEKGDRWEMSRTIGARLCLVDSNDEEMELKLGANSEGMFNVRLKGSKEYWENKENVFEESKKYT